MPYFGQNFTHCTYGDCLQERKWGKLYIHGNWYVIHKIPACWQYSISRDNLLLLLDQNPSAVKQLLWLVWLILSGKKGAKMNKKVHVNYFLLLEMFNVSRSVFQNGMYRQRCQKFYWIFLYATVIVQLSCITKCDKGPVFLR